MKEDVCCLLGMMERQWLGSRWGETLGFTDSAGTRIPFHYFALLHSSRIVQLLLPRDTTALDLYREWGSRYPGEIVRGSGRGK